MPIRIDGVLKKNVEMIDIMYSHQNMPIRIDGLFIKNGDD